MRHLIFKFRFLGLVAVAMLVGVWPMAAQAATATAPGLGSAARFAILSAAPGHVGAVSCTGGTITGNVGSSGPRAAVVQTEGCTITGAITAPVSNQVVADFNTAYSKFPAITCDQILTGTLAGATLAPGVYCFSAAAAPTGTLTLNGPSTGKWIFKIGSGTTPATGALTGTSFSVVMAGGAVPCNVTWWVAQAATFTTSHFVGTILAGAAITSTDGTFTGNALSKAAVTLKGTTLVGCAAGTGHGDGDDKDGHDNDKDGHDNDKDGHDNDKDGHDKDRDRHAHGNKDE